MGENVNKVSEFMCEEGNVMNVLGSGSVWGAVGQPGERLCESNQSCKRRGRGEGWVPYGRGGVSPGTSGNGTRGGGPADPYPKEGGGSGKMPSPRSLGQSGGGWWRRRIRGAVGRRRRAGSCRRQIVIRTINHNRSTVGGYILGFSGLQLKNV